MAANRGPHYQKAKIMTQELKIRDRFITEIETMPVGLPLSYPNKAFDVPTNGRYLEIVRLPNDPIIAGWDRSVDQGIFNLGVHWNNDDGETDVLTICDQIANFFSMGKVMFFTGGKIIISHPPAVRTPMIDGQEAIYPVSIRYQSFAV